MSQHPQAHDEDGMMADPTAVLGANAQEFLESLRPLYARLADLDALLNSEVELVPYSDLFGDFGPFAAAPAVTSQETYDEDVIVDEEDPNMVFWQEAEVQALLGSLREENALVNAVYDTEEAIWSDSDPDENVAHFSIAPADRVTSGPDTDTFMTDAPAPESLAFVMRPLLSPTLPNIVEREPLGLSQTSEVLSSLAPLEGEFVHLQISDEQEDEERRRKNTCPECGLLCEGKLELGDHGVEEHRRVVISIKDCKDDERVPAADEKSL
jgi:hypothetical protein